MITVSGITVALQGLKIVSKLVTAVQQTEAAAVSTPLRLEERTSEIITSAVTFQFSEASTAVENVRRLYQGELGYDSDDPDLQGDPKRAIATAYSKALTKWPAAKVERCFVSRTRHVSAGHNE